MTPYTDPCCHGADVEASTRPRSATPLINHLRHRVVTALCEERSTWRQGLGTCRASCGGGALGTQPPPLLAAIKETQMQLTKESVNWKIGQKKISRMRHSEDR